MFSWAKNKFNQGRDVLQKEVSRYQNKEFMHACIAVSTLIAYSDGGVLPEEKQKLYQFFELNDDLKAFDVEEVTAEFTKLVEKFDFDLEIGKIEALKMIGKVKHRTEQARAAVRLGIIIAKSDANFDEDERRTLIDVCYELDINPETIF